MHRFFRPSAAMRTLISGGAHRKRPKPPTGSAQSHLSRVQKLHDRCLSHEVLFARALATPSRNSSFSHSQISHSTNGVQKSQARSFSSALPILHLIDNPCHDHVCSPYALRIGSGVTRSTLKRLSLTALSSPSSALSSASFSTSSSSNNDKSAKPRLRKPPTEVSSISPGEVDEYTIPLQVPRDDMKRVSFEFCLPAALANQLVEIGGLRMSVNGLQYEIDPSPGMETQDLIDSHEDDLAQLEAKIAPLNDVKSAIDDAAYRKTKLIVWGALGYLFAQSVVVFKLTFFSRFGWDVMEPIAYFITFYTGIFGLLFFQFFQVDYTYPEAFSKLLKKRQEYMYEHEDSFDYELWKQLSKKIERKQLQIQMLTLPRIGQGVDSWDIKT